MEVSSRLLSVFQNLESMLYAVSMFSRRLRDLYTLVNGNHHLEVKSAVEIFSRRRFSNALHHLLSRRGCVRRLLMYWWVVHFPQIFPPLESLLITQVYRDPLGVYLVLMARTARSP